MFKRKDESKQVLENKYIERRKVIIVLVVFFCIIAAVLHSTYINTKEAEKQLQQNLADVARQNAEILRSKIDTQYELLTSLAKDLQDVTQDTIEKDLDQFRIFLEEFNYKRFAFSFEGGMSYSTDGAVTNLSYREFYKENMEGRCCITGVLHDAILPEHDPVNVVTVPVYNRVNKIIGGFGVAYDTAEFNESLQIDSFDGKGSSCIINEEREVMAVWGTDELKLSDNLFDVLLEEDSRNAAVVQEMRTQMQNKEAGGGVAYLGGKSYYYCVPVELMGDCVTWYIITAIPTQVLEERIHPIQMNQYMTNLFVIVLVVVGAMLIAAFLETQHKQMMHYAYEDDVTGGPNFAKFYLDMASKSKPRGYLVAMSIANFNNILIVAGEEASNTMIRAVWEILRDSLQTGEKAAHTRDDTFLLYLNETEREVLIERLKKISEQIGARAGEFCVYGICSEYGIFLMTGNETIDQAYSKAKLAREYATAMPEGNYAFYSEIDRVGMQREKQLEERFPNALKAKEFEVWYQPKYRPDNSAIVGSEALIRWREETGAMISPGEFIPLFERNGMIMQLDEYVFQSVCCQQKKWLEEGKQIIPVSVNISRATLFRADVEQRYLEILQQSGIAPEYIQLEVTETSMKNREDIVELLNRFRKIGIKILMDDFGTGYSSLSVLSTQCFDTLKIDKSLIDRIGDKYGETLLYHVIRMAQQMGLHITAEGVEHIAQVKYLQTLGCDNIQGFYFSRPLPLAEYEKLVNGESI